MAKPVQVETGTDAFATSVGTGIISLGMVVGIFVLIGFPFIVVGRAVGMLFEKRWGRWGRRAGYLLGLAAFVATVTLIINYQNAADDKAAVCPAPTSNYNAPTEWVPCMSIPGQ